MAMTDVPPMRTIEVFSGFGIGGVERSLVARLQRSAARIDTVYVNIGDRNGPMRSDIEALVPIVDIGRFGVVALARRIRSVGPRVVVAHTPRAVVVAVMARILSCRRPSVVAVAHLSVTSDQRWKRLLLRWPLRLVNRRVDLMIAVSEPVRCGDWCAGARRIEVLGLGSELIGRAGVVDPERLWPRDSTIRWLVLGRLAPAKNLVALVRAIAARSAELRAARVGVLIVGDGPLRIEVASAITTADLDDLVTMAPATLEPGPVMIAADALVVASTEEGGPLTICEALLAGTRVLSTPVGIAPELLAGADDPGLLLLAGTSVDDLAGGLSALAALGPLGADERHRRAGSHTDLHVDATAERFIDRLLTLGAVCPD